MSTLSLHTPSPADLPEPAAADPERRRWLLATGCGGALGAAALAVPFTQTLAPSERAKALGAGVQVALGDIPPGGLKTVEWRGKPVWVLHRTPEMLAALQRDDANLADPQSKRDAQPDTLRNAGRSERPEWLVAIGVCTHLGCSPSFLPVGSGNPAVDANWAGGFFCPCHGSTFDLAGRVFKNKPAPTNLEVPPHRFLSDDTLFIGTET
ncbi:MAG: ubiquinol-cytochrome c reductase iron-sulfur subunit [Burkholderiales bacterium]|nr:ubiquinol-cytochrome c reductase iron-sulfur subunit [Burkholderiales bacterium]